MGASLRGGPHYSVTLLEIKTRVWERLDEDSTSPLRYTGARVRQFVNDGLQYMVARAGARINSYTLVTSKGQIFYQLPADCITVLGVDRVTPQEKVWPVDIRELDRSYPSWRAMMGDRAQWYLIFGMDQLVMLPLMSSGGDSYTVTYRQDVGTVATVLDTDVPEVPRRFHDALVDYAVARGLMLNADADALERVVPLMENFHHQVDLLRRVAHRTPDAVSRMREQDFGSSLR